VTHTSTVIVALPAKDSPVHEFGAETKHATLVFLGEVTDPTPAHEAARAVAESSEPFAAEVVRHGKLGSASPPAHVLFLQKDQLADVRNSMLEHSAALRNQYDAIEQFPEYTPHVTVGYPGEGEDADDTPDDDPEEAYANVPEVVFDRIAVWHRGEQTEYPLSPSKLVGLVAGYRYVRTSQGAKRFGVPIGSRIQVDDQGRVVRLDSVTSEKTSKPVVAPSFEKVDPNRIPTKFVATVPGQKAKIPDGTRLSAANVAANRASSQPKKSTPRKPSNANTGITAGMRGALTNVNSLERYHILSKSQLAAVSALRRNETLSSKDKMVLRDMIRAVLRKIVGDRNGTNKTAASKSQTKSQPSKQRTAAQKQATKTAQKASTASTSTAKKKAQSKAQEAATKASALERTLRAAFKALGGNPDALPKDKSYSTRSGSTPAKPNSTLATHQKSSGYKTSYSGSTVASKQNDYARSLAGKSFTSMSDDQLKSSLRSLVAISRSNSSSQVANALRRARQERRRRELRAQLHNAAAKKSVVR
jgi:2'-5' RNA ligase